LILFTFPLQSAKLGSSSFGGPGQSRCPAGVLTSRFGSSTSRGLAMSLRHPSRRVTGAWVRFLAGGAAFLVGRRRSTDKEKFPRDRTLGNAPALSVPRKETALTIADDHSAPSFASRTRARARDARIRCWFGYSVIGGQRFVAFPEGVSWLSEICCGRRALWSCGLNFR
jgi:hypothetical protein